MEEERKENRHLIFFGLIAFGYIRLSRWYLLMVFTGLLKGFCIEKKGRSVVLFYIGPVIYLLFCAFLASIAILVQFQERTDVLVCKFL